MKREQGPSRIFSVPDGDKVFFYSKQADPPVIPAILEPPAVKETVPTKTSVAVGYVLCGLLVVGSIKLLAWLHVI